MWGFGTPTQPAVPLHLSILVAALIVAVWVIVSVFAWWVMEGDPEPDPERAEERDQREAAPAEGTGVPVALICGFVAVAAAIVPYRLVRNVAVGYRYPHESSESWGFAVSLAALLGSLFVAVSFAMLRIAWSAVRPRRGP